MYTFIGVSFLAGTGIILLTTCLTWVFRKKCSKLDEEASKISEKSWKVLEEMLSIIKFIKINVLEKYFIRKVAEAKKAEE